MASEDDYFCSNDFFIEAYDVSGKFITCYSIVDPFIQLWEVVVKAGLAHVGDYTVTLVTVMAHGPLV